MSGKPNPFVNLIPPPAPRRDATTELGGVLAASSSGDQQSGKATQKRSRRVRGSTILFALAWLSFGLTPLWVETVEFGLRRYADTLPGPQAKLFKENSISWRPEWYGISTGVFLSATFNAIGLIRRDLEQE